MHIIFNNEYKFVICRSYLSQSLQDYCNIIWRLWSGITCDCICKTCSSIVSIRSVVEDCVNHCTQNKFSMQMSEALGVLNCPLMDKCVKAYLNYTDLEEPNKGVLHPPGVRADLSRVHHIVAYNQKTYNTFIRFCDVVIPKSKEHSLPWSQVQAGEL